MDAPSSISVPAKTQAHKPLDEKSKVRLQNAVRDFEALFVGYILKTMRSTVPKDEELGEGMGGEMLGSLFDMELAKQISRGSNLGVGEMLYKELTGEKLPHVTPMTQHAAPAKSEAAPLPPAAPSQDQHPVVQPAAGSATAVHLSAGQSVAERVNTWTPIIQQAADEHGLDPDLLKAVMASESAGNADARSSKDAKGLMQLIDSTAAAMGVRNVWNPRENIFGGAKYLQQLLERFRGNLEQAVASYNAGPGAVEKHGGVPPIKETKEYVRRVMSYMQYFQQQEIMGDDDNR
jgi:Rod binding domain-containing protein